MLPEQTHCSFLWVLSTESHLLHHKLGHGPLDGFMLGVREKALRFPDREGQPVAQMGSHGSLKIHEGILALGVWSASSPLVSLTC